MQQSAKAQYYIEQNSHSEPLKGIAVAICIELLSGNVLDQSRNRFKLPVIQMLQIFNNRL